ncbi:serine-aspartate repeat-containing protein C-like [Perca fluviatilis]|uniref:serine-aspartate repeat-containing protein C-like n=1 Tax=Perca fluviatilis TaxID=8168 RepID=UPI0019654F8A|nr:serine-aspartate repeat-containing protein C-like [Perca fluviatilis]
MDQTPVPDDQLSTIPQQTGTHHLAEVKSNDFAGVPSTTPASEDSTDNNSDDSSSWTSDGDDQSDYSASELSEQSEESTSDTDEQSEESPSEDRSSSAEEGTDQDARQALQSRVAMDSTEPGSPPPPRPLQPQVLVCEDTPEACRTLQEINNSSGSDEAAQTSVSTNAQHNFAFPFCPARLADTLITSEDRPFLPPVVIQRIIEETLSAVATMPFSKGNVVFRGSLGTKLCVDSQTFLCECHPEV